MNTKDDIGKACTNCEKHMPNEASFCPYCGQTTKIKKINLFDSIKELFENFVFFDLKIFKTLYALLIPGKLTKAYFAGKHGKYTSPWRLFFITIVTMLIVINIDGKITDSKDSFINIDNLSDTNNHDNFQIGVSQKGINLKFNNKKDGKDTIISKKILKEMFENISNKDDIDSLVTELSKDSIYTKNQIDSITKSWIGKFNKRPFSIKNLKDHLIPNDYNNIQKLFSDFDTTYLKADSLLRLAIDSSSHTLSQQLKDIYIDSFTLYNIRISKYDINTMSRIELKKKYNIESKGTFKDAVNDISYKFNSGKFTIDKFFDFALNNLNWFIIFLLPFAALFFKLFYIRRKRYYVEHLIFNLHNHTAILILFTIFIISQWFKTDVIDDVFGVIISIGPILYYILAMKYYYSQSWFKTILKFFLFMFLYFILMIISTISYMIIAAVFIE